MSFWSIVKKVFFWLIFLGFWGITIWTLLFSDVMKVETVVVDSEKANKKEVKKIAQSEMRGNYLGVVPKGNLLVIPKKKIRESLQESFIFIRSVSIEKDFPKTIKISLEERENHLIWCSRASCFFVDENAEAFFVADISSEDQIGDLVIVSDISEKEIGIGERVAKVSFVKFCENLPQIIKQQTGIEIEKNISTPSFMSEEVRARTKDGWQILFSTSREIDTQAKIINKILRESIPEEKRGEIEYLDLRIKGKATFKLKGEEKDEEEKDDEDNEDEE